MHKPVVTPRAWCSVWHPLYVSYIPLATGLLLPLEIWALERKACEIFFLLAMEAQEEVNFPFPGGAACGGKFV